MLLENQWGYFGGWSPRLKGEKEIIINNMMPHWVIRVKSLAISVCGVGFAYSENNFAEVTLATQDIEKTKGCLILIDTNLSQEVF
jgi:hypothetical protein